VARRDIPGRVRDALAVVQLEHLAGRRPSELSGGQQQRVALARAIVARPRVLLMDEPLGALDKLLREQLQLEIRRLHQELGITFVFVTHDQDEALAMSDRIALLRDGSIVQVGSPQSLYERPNCRYTAEFVGASNLFRGTADGGVLVDEVTGVRLRVPGTGRGAVCVLVRPERMHVGARDVTVPPDCDVAHGIVEDCIYLGSSRRVEVRLTGGRTVVLRTDVPRGGDEVRHGADVTVWWRVDDAAVLADDPAGTADPEPSGVLAAQH
jgi:putative spermidine/putrescine transport system ATP-binding protein